MKGAKGEMKEIALDLMLTSQDRDVAQLFYELGFIDYEDAEDLEKIYDAIKKQEKLNEKLLKDDVFVLENYALDLIKTPEELKKILEISEKGLKDLEEKREDIVKFLFKEENIEKFQKNDELSKIYQNIFLEDLENIEKQISLKKKTIEFLERKLGIRNKDDEKEKINIKKILELNIEDVIEKEAGVKINRRGDPIMIRCVFPDHKDENPSFAIYKKTNSFYCFGCARGGSVVNFISHLHSLTIKDALKYLHNKYVK